MAASVQSAYRSAFEDFSRKAQRVQFLAEHPTGDQSAFEAALLDLESAHLTYDEARDALVDALLPSARKQRYADGADDYRSDIKTIAQLLWESAGRPTGTAEDDWRRAESIVKRAVAASCGA